MRQWRAILAGLLSRSRGASGGRSRDRVPLGAAFVPLAHDVAMSIAELAWLG